MGYLTIILIALGLSMDSLAVCISGGIFMKKFCIRKSLKMAFIMGFFQGGMTLLGWALRSKFSSYISDFDHWIAFILLVYLGGKMIYESFRDESFAFHPDITHTGYRNQYRCFGCRSQLCIPENNHPVTDSDYRIYNIFPFLVRCLLRFLLR